MRLLATCALTLLAFTPPAISPAEAQSAPAALEETSAEQVVARLKEASRVIARSGGTDLRAEARAAAADIDSLVNRLESGSESSLAMGRAVLTVAEDYAVLAPSCPGEDLAALLGAFRENLRRVLDESGSSHDTPRILRVTGVEDDKPIGVRTGSARVLVLHGTSLHSDDCGPASALITKGDAPPVEVEAYSHGPTRLDFTVPALEQPGAYDVTVRLRRRKLLFLCRTTTASFTIAALPPGEFRVEYEITSMRTEEQRIVWNAGELKLTNERCDTDTTAVHRFRLPDGWKYASHDWIVYLNEGAVKQREEVIGDEVEVEYRLPRRGPLCRGDARLIHGKMEIRGTRQTVVAGPRFAGRGTRTLGPGERLGIALAPDSATSSSPPVWSVEVRLIHPDGRIQKMSAGSGEGPLTGSGARGGGWVWNPAKGTLRVSAPGRSCPSA